MNKAVLLKISGTTIQIINKKPTTTLETIYGVGRAKAKKIKELLLTNPFSKNFKKSLVDSSQEMYTQRLFKSIIADNNLKLVIYSNLEKKARIGCYVAHRILQNLPAHGQRTHTNAGTPNRLNPFVALGLKSANTTELIHENYRWELNWNGRSSDLLEFTANKADTKKYSRAASLAKKKKKEEKLKKKKK